MTTNPLPDLSKWHEVPIYADIPADTPYAWQDADGTWGASDGLAGSRYVASARATGTRYFTAKPIPAPRPTPPPTEPGAVLVDVTDADGNRWDRAYSMPASDNDDLPWRVHSFASDRSCWRSTADLLSWTAADVVPRKAAPDPLDENDHRDRVDPDGDRWRWIDGMWHIDKDGHPPRATLGKVVHYAGPVRFADEVQS